MEAEPMDESDEGFITVKRKSSDPGQMAKKKFYMKKKRLTFNCSAAFPSRSVIFQ